MQREVQDGEGTTWVCVQAYAGLEAQGEGDEELKETAARVEGGAERFEVVCTPSGGAQTVRLQLPGGWDESYSDEELLREIEARKSGG